MPSRQFFMQSLLFNSAIFLTSCGTTQASDRKVCLVGHTEITVCEGMPMSIGGEDIPSLEPCEQSVCDHWVCQHRADEGAPWLQVPCAGGT